MALQGISTGTTPNDGTGDSLLVGAVKVNDNFQEIYDALGDGTSLLTGNPDLTVGFITATGAYFNGDVGIAGTLNLVGNGVTITSTGVNVTGVVTASYFQSSLGISTNSGTTTAQINVDSTGSQLIITVPGVGSTTLPLT